MIPKKNKNKNKNKTNDTVENSPRVVRTTLDFGANSTSTSSHRSHRSRTANKRFFCIAFIIIAISVIISTLVLFKNPINRMFDEQKIEKLGNLAMPDWVDTQIIDIDGVSRRGEKLVAINSIVIHYVANPKSTAQQNRDFFNSDNSQVSSHFVVGLDGEIIQCVPLDEKSSASNDRNSDTISIEVCHPDKTGKFNKKTTAALVKLTAWLCKTNGLDKDDIIRHYDVTGKLCPLYFVENEDAWNSFKDDIIAYKKDIK